MPIFIGKMALRLYRVREGRCWIGRARELGCTCFRKRGGQEQMANVIGSSTAEIDAPIDRVWALVEDVEQAPEWQGGLKAIRALERDDDGRVVLCESASDAKVRTINSTVRFAYDAPTSLTWSQVKGEVKSVEGRWDLEDLGDSRTRATYSLDVDLGRMLGMVIRGPLVDLLRDMLAGARARELKQRIEEAASD
jgi:carbon monoxide dehydrogenase subunit G